MPSSSWASASRMYTFWVSYSYIPVVNVPVTSNCRMAGVMPPRLWLRFSKAKTTRVSPSKSCMRSASPLPRRMGAAPEAGGLRLRAPWRILRSMSVAGACVVSTPTP